MQPLSLDDDQMKVVIDCASAVPPKLRESYLRGVAKRLSGGGDIEKIVSTVLAKLDRIAKLKGTRVSHFKKTTGLKNNPVSTAAKKQKDYRKSRDAGTINPHIPVTSRHVDMLIRRAVTYGTLTRGAGQGNSEQEVDRRGSHRRARRAGRRVALI